MKKPSFEAGGIGEKLSFTWGFDRISCSEKSGNSW
jgi:hypothetical protein